MKWHEGRGCGLYMQGGYVLLAAQHSVRAWSPGDTHLLRDLSLFTPLSVSLCVCVCVCGRVCVCACVVGYILPLSVSPLCWGCVPLYVSPRRGLSYRAHVLLLSISFFNPNMDMLLLMSSL
jgi:hypothetical protein